MTRELRTFDLDIEVRDDNGSPKIVGHGLVYNSPSYDLGGFREIVAPGAASKSLNRRGAVVMSFFNHDPSHPLGRTDNKTLTISEDERGIVYEVEPPDTQWARDLMTSIKRKDIRGSSFTFRTIKDRWEEQSGIQVRTLLEIDVFEMGPVTMPAYGKADAQVRAMLEARGIVLANDGEPAASALLELGLDPARLEYLARNRRTGLWTDAETDELRQVLDLLQTWIPAESREEPPPEPDDRWRVAAAHRRRGLELLKLRHTA